VFTQGLHRFKLFVMLRYMHFLLFGKVVRLVNNEIFLAKLNLYGIQETSAYWFRSCLTDRRQEVEMNSCNETQNFF
jgi:hypothetical protein